MYNLSAETHLITITTTIGIVERFRDGNNGVVVVVGVTTVTKAYTKRM